MATVASRKASVKPARKDMVVSLALAIDHQVYDVTPLVPQDLDVVSRCVWRLEKKSDPDAVYDVCVTSHGFDCTCPDFEARRRGLDAAGCKHCKALVACGLLDPPAPTPVPTPAQLANSASCCAPTEPAPCVACTEAADACAPAEAEDAGPPESWPAEADSWFWTLTDGIDVPPAEEPAPAIPEADRAWAAEHLNNPPLADQVEAEAAKYLATGTAFGRFLSDQLTALALRIRISGATSPEDAADRLDRLDTDIRLDWESRGYEAALQAAR